MTHVVHQSTLQFTRAALLGLLLTAAACTLFHFTTAPVTATQGATAQPSPTRQVYNVRVTHVKPGMAAAFRELHQKEVLPALKKGGVKELSFWTTATYGEGYENVTVSPSEGLKRLDEPSALTRALGEEGARALTTKWGQLVTDTRQFSLQTRPELSIPPKTNDAPKLAVVYRSQIAPGRVNEYEEVFKNFTLPWLRKSEHKGFLLGRVGFGGDSNEYIGMFLLDSFTDMDKWVASFANAGSGPGAKLAGIMLHQESAVYRYVPEMSIRPESQRAAK